MKWFSAKERGHSLVISTHEIFINGLTLTEREPHESMSKDNPKGDFTEPIFDEELNEWVEGEVLADIKNKKLEEIRSLTGNLIDNRYKPFDRENLFVLENKSDINDYLTGNRVGKQIVKDNILSIRTACNDLEGQIESATTKEELELIDISQENLKTLAGWPL